MKISSLKSNIQQICKKAILLSYPNKQAVLQDFSPEIILSSREKFGHYQCNSAMKLTKILENKSLDIAKNWLDSLKKLSNQQFSKIEIAGPGFLNFTLNSKYITEQLNLILLNKNLGINGLLNKKVVIDYSSPNTAKDMHVGHLRSTIIGDCISKVLEFLGCKVLRLNHIGDWGTQFGMLIAYIKHINVDLLNSREEISLPQLSSWYRAAKKLFDSDIEFKKISQNYVVLLQNNDLELIQLWQSICDISRSGYEEIYSKLNIKGLIERGESFYNNMLPEIIVDLANKGLLTESNHAQCVFLDGFINREGEPLPLIVKKQDGAYNYATTELAALKHRVSVEKAENIIYLTDYGQKQHLQMVFAAANKAGYYDPQKVQLDHVAFGLVLREDGKKFKTRSGDTEKLIDLINKAITKARVELAKRNPDYSLQELDEASQILGIGAIKYADLSTHRLSDYVFSYEKMLQFEGNTVAFILYAYVRTQSIQRKTNKNISDIIASGEQIVLSSEPAEFDLVLHLNRFSESIEKVYQELLPNRLTDYLFKLAEKFHAFFHACRVEGNSYENSRLLICQQTALTITVGLDLLGIQTISRM